ncbi:MAG TPA: hypothetical protein VFW87_25010, partial [Pirellulales bacterium]|nr:hypothetical protein [Pirellulales bacterium]
MSIARTSHDYTDRGNAPQGRRIRAVEDFRRALLHERARTDRSGNEFSLVAFAPGDHRSTHAMRRRLAKTLAGRLRAIDQIGWLDDGRLAALLPYTPAEGAWNVADDVCLLLPEWLPPPV